MGSLDIIILLVAVILIFQKLRSLLGTRPDTEITRTKISEESAAKIFDMIVKEAEKQPFKTKNCYLYITGYIPYCNSILMITFV